MIIIFKKKLTFQKTQKKLVLLTLIGLALMVASSDYLWVDANDISITEADQVTEPEVSKATDELIKANVIKALKEAKAEDNTHHAFNTGLAVVVGLEMTVLILLIFF